MNTELQNSQEIQQISGNRFPSSKHTNMNYTTFLREILVPPGRVPSSTLQAGNKRPVCPALAACYDRVHTLRSDILSNPGGAHTPFGVVQNKPGTTTTSSGVQTVKTLFCVGLRVFLSLVLRNQTVTLTALNTTVCTEGAVRWRVYTD